MKRSHAQKRGRTPQHVRSRFGAPPRPSLRQRLRAQHALLVTLREHVMSSTTALFTLLIQLGGEYIITEETIKRVSQDFRFLRSDIVQNPPTSSLAGELNAETFTIRLLFDAGKGVEPSVAKVSIDAPR